MRRDALRNHRLVVEAAREVFSEHGPDAGMELIASRAGVGVGTVYRRFPSKEALVEELVRLILTELAESARELLARNDGRGLEDFLRVLGRSLSEHRGYAGMVVSSTQAGCAATLRGMLAQLLEQSRRHGTVGPFTTMGDVLATVWALRGIVETTGTVAPHAWERHLDIHLAGLRSPAEPSARPGLTDAELARINSATGTPRPATP
jgi:AcrR family transcriptional regulator